MDHCRVVLVRTKFAGNLGATARVMRNLGLTRMILVAPEANPEDRQARQLSTHGEPILDAAKIVGTLDEAVADCTLVVGTSARTGGPYRRQSVGTPEEILPRLLDVHPHPAALVFGPESSGLTDAEVTRCHHLVSIPADPGYPAFNLSQAAAICLYVLRSAWLQRQPTKTSAEPPAPFEAQERMFVSLREALTGLHFLYGQSADTLWHGVRHLLGRARPTQQEVDMLFGLARQIRWYVEEHERKRG